MVTAMVIAGVLCLLAAAVSAGMGTAALVRPHGGDRARQVLRSVAPTQLAAGAILAAGGVVALVAAPNLGLPVVIVCVLGALATIGAGSVQGARYVAAAEAQAPSGGCGQACASCTLSCG